LEWLCDAVVTGASVTRANLGLRLNTVIEADWLWRLLSKEVRGQSLLNRAQTIADMNVGDKALLLSWVQTVIDLTTQFQPGAPAWPNPKTDPSIPPDAQKALSDLMQAFYTKGLKPGLPYSSDGTPVVNGGVTYADFVQEFRAAHRLDLNPDSREVCVLCGGPFVTPEVDHWVAKAAFSLLSVCGDNLLPICGDCNSPSNKGTKPVFSEGPAAFSDWFHPYLRSGYGTIKIEYDSNKRKIIAAAMVPADAAKIGNLDGLLNLASRWTLEFKAEYQDLKKTIRQLIQLGRLACTALDIEQYVLQKQAELLSSEPNYEVYSTLMSTVLEQTRLASWQTELDLENIA